MSDTDAHGPRRARYVSAGFLTDKRIRRIAQLSGLDLRLGSVAEGDVIAAWGHAATATRAEALAARTGAPIVRLEDAFLRSLHPGRAGEPTLGLTIDDKGAYFDARQPSDLETLLAEHPLDDGALLARAHQAIDRMRSVHLTKYSAVDITATPPDPGYVLVIDQTRDDASIRLGGATAATFREMLVFAQEEHPHTRIIIKSHPETLGGLRPGHYGAESCGPKISLETRPLSPWALFEGAVAVYTVSSQLGFEAILAGHKPHVFGQPFYAGWGLTDDRTPVDRRTRTLTRAQLFAGAMMLYPKWYSPFTDALCEIEDVMETLEAQARAWREDQRGYLAVGMRLWKRPHLQKMFGQERPVIFRKAPDAPDRPVLVWGTAETPALRAACLRGEQPLIRVEDGFLRSRGLGARLVPPLSLTLDRRGLHYDPSRVSELELAVEKALRLSGTAQVRADRLRAAIIKLGITKYNLGGEPPPAPPEGQRVVLVPGQVEDDASIRLGADRIKTNAALLRQARELHPKAFIIYKPHPDVEAGLRPGAISAQEADVIVRNTDLNALFALSDDVVTITSGLGFEALLREIPVTTLGAPFYAGWGLTRDLGRIPARRQSRPTLLQFIHAALITYPRYFDPFTGLPCPPEVAVMRLAQMRKTRRGIANGALARVQGAFASMPWLWR
jgi:capsular polysaccharide export protein